MLRCCILLFPILLCIPDFVYCLRVPDAQETFDAFPQSITVPYHDFYKHANRFGSPDFEDFQPILIDSLRRQIIVGARDAILVLDGETMKLITKVNWPANKRDIDLCQMKGQKAEDCHNFIRTLVTHGDRTLICGTHAFSPQCTWRQSSDLRTVLESEVDGVGTSPYSRDYMNKYVMSSDGHLFTGIVTDFSGHDSSILRIFPQNRLLRTAKANNRWINDPDFVAAFEEGNFIYFFFRETAVETAACGERRLSRVARMCKNDVGGDIMLQGTWTTFTKATINCPFADGSGTFDHLQDVHFDSTEGIFYAIFTHSRGLMVDSAVCLYNMTSLRTAFGGPYLYQNDPNAPWIEHLNNNPYFDCEVQGVTSARPGMTRRSLSEAHKYQLMAHTVKPMHAQPLHHAPLESYEHIIVDTVRVKHIGLIQVLFIITNTGLMKKMTILPESVLKSDKMSRTCLVEVVQLSGGQNDFKIKSIQFFKSKDSLIIGTDREVLQVSVHRCSKHGSRLECVDAQDPYCGWDSKQNVCSTAPGKITSHRHWHQNLKACPNTNIPIDGEFGDWSEWKRCPRQDLDGQDCQCRTRQCDSPKPRLNGAHCQGDTVQITNCSRGGNWTEWTDWSACSFTCGAGVQVRKRQCSNPSPAYGGNECEGEGHETQVCLLDDCPMATVPPTHGGWSEWTGWQRCSRDCGGGIRKRARFCNNPTPINDGFECAGCHNDYQVCNTEPCQEVRRWTDWTPWLQANSSKDSTVYLKRYKFACRARIDDPKLMSVSRPRVEEKICSKDNDCTDTAFAGIDGGWSGWAEWSECSQSCGNGSQSRIRACSDPSPSATGLDCPGHSKEIRQCNSHDCQASWSCWSDYSECSVSCGTGITHRTRKCHRPHGEEPCPGDRLQTEHCSSGPCTHDGYGIWSGWSTCGDLGVKVRIRPCISDSYCNRIPDAQMKKCYSTKTNSMASRGEPDTARLPLYLGIVAAFVCGAALTLLLSCWAVRSRSNCCYGPAAKPQRLPTTLPVAAPVKSSNIYSQPPDKQLTNTNGGGHHTYTAMTSIAANPLTQLLSHEKAMELAELDALNEHDASLSLRRTMRASLNPRDYL